MKPVEVKVEVDNLDESGNVYLNFKPAIVMVPNDWETMWSLAEREKMTIEERLEYEEGLLDIMHVTFELNSDELP